MSTQAPGKRKFVPYAVTVAFLVLIFLLMRENEGRTAAETKLQNAQHMVEELRSEKSSLANELEAQVTELETKLQELSARYDALLIEKRAEAERYEARISDAAVQHDAELKEKDSQIADGDARAKADAKKLNDLLAEKKTEITDMGARLEEASAKYSELLKKREALESRALSCEDRVGELEQSLKKAERLSAELNDTVQKGQLQKSAVD